MYIYSIFFAQLVYGILALLITYTIGKLITSFFSISGGLFFRLFVTYVIGITSIVLFYSVIKTQGKTVNILLLPTIVILIYYYKHFFIKAPIFQFKESLKEILWSIIPFLIVFAYQSWFYFDFEHNEIKPLFIDTLNYGFSSNVLKDLCLENANFWIPFFFKKSCGAVPYHYPELWTTAFFSQIFKNSTTNVYHFITLPLLVCFSIIGICSFFEKTNYKRIILLLLAIPLPFILGDRCWTIVCYFGQKMAFINVFFLLSFYLIKEKNWLIGSILLFTIIFFSITLMPAIIGGFLSFLVIKYILDKNKNIKEPLLLLSILFINLLLFLLFYSLNKSNTNTIHSSSIYHSPLFNGATNNISYLNFKIVIANLIYNITPKVFYQIKDITILLSLFLLLMINSFKKNIYLFILLFCMVISGAFASKIMCHLFDSGQLLDSIQVLIGIYIIVLISDMLISKNKYNIICLTIVYYLIFINIPGIIGTNNILRINNDIELSKKAAPLLVTPPYIILTFPSIKAPLYDGLNNSLVYGNHWLHSNGILSITQFTNKTIINTIGNPEVYLKKGKLSYEDSIFYFHTTPLNVWRDKGKRYSLETFIQKYKIKYFYFHDSVQIPNFIVNKIDTMIVSTSTGSKFIRIR